MIKKIPPLNNIENTFIRFCLVGGTAFLIDSTLLLFFNSYLGIHPVLSRCFSFLAVCTFTWWMNRHFTFQIKHRSKLFHEWFRYATINGVGICMNWTTYISLVYSLPFCFQYPFFALVGATATSMFINYYLIKKYAFKKKSLIN